MKEVLSMEFSRQEYWSGFTIFPSPGDLPDPGTEPRSPPFQADSLPPESRGQPHKESFSSVAQSCSTPWTGVVVQVHGLQHSRLPSPSPTPRACLNSSIKSVMPSNPLIICHPFFFLPSVFPSIRVFSNESTFCIRWSKYWSFSISPSNEQSGLISYRIDWFDLLAV